MFIQNPRTIDFRYSMIDENHAVGKLILSTSRRAASKHIKNQDYSKEQEKLSNIYTNLDMGEINILSAMYMISNQWNGATGQGSIWAVASEIVNNTARQELKQRPVFETV